MPTPPGSPFVTAERVPVDPRELGCAAGIQLSRRSALEEVGPRFSPGPRRGLRVCITGKPHHDGASAKSDTTKKEASDATPAEAA